MQLPKDFDIEPWRAYLKAAAIGIGFTWVLVIAYLLFFPKSFTSTWALLVLGTDPNLDVRLSGVGQTTAGGERQLDYQDPRDDYIYIASSIEIQKLVAERAGIEYVEDDLPEITAEADSAIIAFGVNGETAEEAQQKAIAWHDVLLEKIEDLRRGEIQRRRMETEVMLRDDRSSLDEAQSDIAEFKRNSIYHSEDQLTSLSAAIEGLRAEQSELRAELQGLKRKLEHLSSGQTLSQSDIVNAYTLQNDPIFRTQIDEYGATYIEYSNLSALVGENHPSLKEKQVAVDATLGSLKKRAHFLLDREVEEQVLIQLNAPEWLATSTEYVTLKAKDEEMENQINVLEQRLAQLDWEMTEFSRLEARFLVSESVLAGSFARLEVNQNDIYSIYPPVQLVVAPDLPDEASAPDLKVGLLGGVALSFLWVSFLIFLKWERNSPWRNPDAWVN